MLRKKEISSGVESLIRMRSYWIQNNSLNFIDRIRRERPLTKRQSDSLNRIKKSIENIRIDHWQTHSNYESICQIKNLVLEIRMLF
jgi:hypothetical protein